MVYKATYNWRAPSCSGSTDPSSLKKKAASHTHGPCHHPGVLCRQVQGVQLPFSVRLGGELRSAEKPTRGWLKSHPLMWIWGTFVDGFTWVYHGQITEIELFMTRSSDLYSRFIFFRCGMGPQNAVTRDLQKPQTSTCFMKCKTNTIRTRCITTLRKSQHGVQLLTLCCELLLKVV